MYVLFALQGFSQTLYQYTFCQGEVIHSVIPTKRPLIQSETKVSETTKSANKYISAEERKNNSLFHAQSTVKLKVSCRQESLNKVSIEFAVRVYYTIYRVQSLQTLQTLYPCFFSSVNDV